MDQDIQKEFDKINVKLDQILKNTSHTDPPPVNNDIYKSISDRVVRPKPTLPILGPAGTIFNDPTFNNRILRVTDEKTGNGTSYNTIGGGRYWNSTGDMFTLINTGGGVSLWSFDFKNMKAQWVKDLRFTFPGEWHDTNDSLIFGAGVRNNDEATIRTYNVITQDYVDLFGVRDLVPDVDKNGRTYVRGITFSNSKLAFLFGGTSQDKDYLVYYGGLDGKGIVLNTLTNSWCGFLTHAIALDLNGRYVILGPTQTYIQQGKPMNIVWDTIANTFIYVTQDTGGHGSLGYGSGINNPDNNDSMEWIYRDLPSPNVSTEQLIQPYPNPKDFQQSSHSSWNNAKQGISMPIIGGMFRYGGNYKQWREWDEEILAINTGVAITKVWRFCHHRSDYNNITPTDRNPFAYTPRPCVSLDGKYCLFTSNWEKTLGRDSGQVNARQDVFLVELK